MSDPRASQWGQPGHSALSPVRLIFAFVAVFLVIVIAAALAIVVFGPRTPPPDCLPGQICGGPPATPPPVTGEASVLPVTPGPVAAATGTPVPSAPTLAPATPIPAPPTTGTPPAPAPTPASTDAPPSPSATPALSPPVATASPEGTLPPADELPQPAQGDPASPALRTWPSYTDPTWGHTIYYPPFLTPEQLDSGGVVLSAGIPTYDVQVAVRFDVASASVTPEQLRAQLVEDYRGRISSMAGDESPLMRVHRPSIGQIPAIVSGYRGDLGTSGSLSPVALVVMAATDGRITVAVSVIVSNPDTVLPGTPLSWYRASGEVVDPMLKRLEWGDGS